MHFSPLPGLGLNFVELLLLMVGAGVASLILRRNKWASALWLPLTIVSGFSSLKLHESIQEHSGPGMEALGALFLFLFGWPWLVLFVVQLIAFPRKWSVLSILIGLSLTVAAFAIPYYAVTKKLVMQVIGPDGQPVPQLTLFTGKRSRSGEMRHLDDFTTNTEGTFWFRFDAEKPIKFVLGMDKKYYSTELEVRAVSDNAGKPKPDALSVIYYWGFAGSSQLSQCSALEINPDKHIPFFLKPLNRLVDRPLQEQIRTIITDARNTGANARVLTNACRNPESLDLINDLADLIPAHPELHDSAIDALQYVAEILRQINDLRSPHLNGVHKPWNAAHPHYALLCDWAGISSQTPPDQAKAEIVRKIDSYAGQLIERSRPYWTEEHHSVHVIEALGRAGRPAIAKIPEALEHAQPRAREAMLECLWHLQPTLENMAWFVNNGNPKMVLAGYYAVKDTLKRDKLPEVINRLEAMKASSVSLDDADSRKLAYLIATFKQQNDDPHYRPAYSWMDD